MRPAVLGSRIPGWAIGVVVGLVLGAIAASLRPAPEIRRLEAEVRAAQSEVQVARTTLARTRDVADSLSGLLRRAEVRGAQVTAPLRGRGPMGVRPIVQRVGERVDTLQPALPAEGDTTPLELVDAARALPLVVAALDSVTFAAQARELAAVAERAATTLMLAQQDSVIARQATLIRTLRRPWWRRTAEAVGYVAAGVLVGALVAR